ncbi:MAG: Cryptochrome-like protein cry2 [Pseudomonadota bacterium]|jgi:deoxyribodipyrimidine photo-lyase
MGYELIWFKRDLRWQDHAALARASCLGPVRCIYVVEPGLWLQPDAALQHFEFVRESLQSLDAALRRQGGGVEIHCGEMPEVLDRLWQQAPFGRLHAHEETGNGWTYERDLRVHAWCRAHGVTWHEYPQFGVVRRLGHRNLWQGAYETHMAMPQESPGPLRFWWPAAESAPPGQRHDEGPGVAALRVTELRAPAHLTHNPPRRQRGGRELALATLHSFLHGRSLGYRGGMSSPLTAPDACSRLSPYLAWGCISMREVVQQTREHLARLPEQATRHRAGLLAFLSRLYWHCHFIQKLESEPAIEWRNMHRGYDGLREDEFSAERFAALCEGRTGWPMVDACVAMLRETGWLNFRMRAMLVSVAAYPLWLHWRPVGEWLARQFLDYEPGIHWSQLQMQSGTTGINATRVYNPVKQAQDHDPHGRFVRAWLPALRPVPDEWLFEPWLMPPLVQQQLGLQVGTDIARPLLDLKEATRVAKQRLYERRHSAEVRAGKQAVIEKHASRKNWRMDGELKSKPRRAGKAVKAVAESKPQMGFDF